MKIYNIDQTRINKNEINAKFWTVEETNVLVQYEFNSSVYENLLPEFNSNFTADMYTVSDEYINDYNVIRTLYYVNEENLPTYMIFGNKDVTEGNEIHDKQDALLKFMSIVIK